MSLIRAILEVKRINFQVPAIWSGDDKDGIEFYAGGIHRWHGWWGDDSEPNVEIGESMNDDELKGFFQKHNIPYEPGQWDSFLVSKAYFKIVDEDELENSK
jgi:hypothetical protein